LDLGNKWKIDIKKTCQNFGINRGHFLTILTFHKGKFKTNWYTYTQHCPLLKIEIVPYTVELLKLEPLSATATKKIEVRTLRVIKKFDEQVSSKRI